LERRAYRSTFDDGVYDIQFGLLFLVFTLISVLEAIGISRFAVYPLLVIPLLFPWFGKRYVTIPRMGAVEFDSARKSKKRLLTVIGTVIVVLTLPLMVIISKGVISGSVGWMLVAAFGFPVFAIAVYSMDLPRLYIYAAVLVAGVVESEFLLDPVGRPFNVIISFGIPGIIIMAVGILLLVRFVRTYPKSGREAQHVC
jgi:hypothetical protein